MKDQNGCTIDAGSVAKRVETLLLLNFSPAMKVQA